MAIRSDMYALMTSDGVMRTMIRGFKEEGEMAIMGMLVETLGGLCKKVAMEKMDQRKLEKRDLVDGALAIIMATVYKRWRQHQDDEQAITEMRRELDEALRAFGVEVESH